MNASTSISSSAPSALSAVKNSAPLEVIDPQQSAAILTRCEKHISTGIDHLASAEKTCDGWRFFLGLHVRTAKPHLEHGQFEEWVEKKFETNHRTANNWVRFAECLVGRAHALIESGNIKRETVSLLLEAPQKVADGSMADRELPTILDIVPQITGGLPMMQFIKQNTEKPTRKITFHCDHCGAANTGFIGREITCVNKECAQKITVHETETPEEQIKAAIKDAEDITNHHANALRGWCENKRRHDISREALRSFIDACVDASKEARAILKKRKTKKPSREGAKSRKEAK